MNCVLTYIAILTVVMLSIYTVGTLDTIMLTRDIKTQIGYSNEVFFICIKIKDWYDE